MRSLLISCRPVLTGVLAGVLAGGLALGVLLSASTPSVGEDFRPVLMKTSAAEFSRPHDLVLSPDGRFLFVADNGNDVVKVLGPDSLRVLTVIGDGQLSAPHDVTFDAGGRLLVADTGNDRIAVYRFGDAGPKDPGKTELIETWNQDMGSPEGVAVGAKGRVFVTNAGLDTVMALEGGRVVKIAGGSGRGNNQYNRPHDVHVDRRGRVIIADSGNNRFQVLDRDLNFRGAWRGPPYHFNEPKYLADAEDGMVFIADEYNNRIVILNESDQPVGMFGGKVGPLSGLLNQPEGVEVKGGRLWISDTYNNRILLFRRP